MYLIGIVGMMVVMVFGAVITGLGPLQLLDGGSLLIVLLPALLAAVAAAKPGELKLLTTVFSARELDDRERTRAAGLFRLMGNVALGAGLIGLLIALVQIASSFPAGSSPVDTAALGRALSAALLTPLYGLFFKFFIFEPAATRIQ